MTSPLDRTKCMVTLVFWQLAHGKVEFFVPFRGSYLGKMRGLVDPPVGVGARAMLIEVFDLQPRSNARIFYLPGGCVAAFTLTSVEMSKIAHLGDWLPSTLIMDPSIGFILRDVADKLRP